MQIRRVNYRRLSCFITIGLILVSVLAVTLDIKRVLSQTRLLVDSDFDASTDSADLRNNGSGQDWYESRGAFGGTSNSSLLTLDTSNVGGNSGKKAGLKSYGISQDAYLTQEFNSSQSGNFTVSLDVYIDRVEDNANYDRSGLIYVGDDSILTNCPTGTSNERFVFLTFYDSTPGDTGTDLEIRARTSSSQSYSNTSAWTQVATGLSYDTWYRIKVDLDVAGGTYDVYVDGVLEGDDVAKYSGYASSSVSYISFAADGDGRGDWYIDNVFAPSVDSLALEVDTGFDSASIESYTIVGNEMNFTLVEESFSNNPNNYTYWTNFKVRNVFDKEVTFRITNADEVPFLSTTTEEAQMGYSYDGENWNRFTTHSYSGGVYTFTETFDHNDVQIATFFPFSYAKMQDYTGTVNSSQWATGTILGSSEEGRNIDLLKITNPSIPDSNKKVIYIIGRQHAHETASSHMLKGMIDFLISTDSDAERMRDNHVWYIVPMVNPDGVYLGKSRGTSEGRDPNRDWKNNETVEIKIVRDHINLIDNTYEIDFFIDWHSQMNDDRWYNFVYSPPGNTFFSILSTWTDFDSQSSSAPGVGSSSSCTSRQYISHNILYDPMFVLEPTPHLHTWTISSLMQEGENIAYAIDEYFAPVFPEPLLADSEFNNSTDSAGLRTNSAWQDWYESRAANPNQLSLDETDVGGNAGRKAALEYFGIGGSGYVYLTQEFSSAQNGAFNVSLDMLIDRILDESDYDRTGYIYIGDDNQGTNGPCSTSIERFVFLTFYDSTPGDTGTDLEIRAREFDGAGLNVTGPAQPWGDTSTWTQVATGLSYDTWYTIRIEVDFSNGTYDLYVDDILEGDDIGKWEKYPSSTVTHISFSAGTAGEGDFYVDNVFSPVQERYKLAIIMNGNGTVTKNPAEATYSYSTEVTLTATPDTGWSFSGWTGDLVSTDNPVNITMDSDKDVTATFVAGSPNLVVDNIVIEDQGCQIYANDTYANGTAYYIPVKVTIKNTGNYSAGQFNVSLEAYWTTGTLQESLVELTVPSLDAGENATLTFYWRPTHTRYYNLTATVDCDSEVDEDDEGDNSLSESNVPVSVIGDINGDGVVNIFDAVVISLAWDSDSGSGHWNLCADLNHDGHVDILDGVRIGLHWGETW